MRRILSIARLTFREALRSKLILTLAAALAVVVFGLPAILKGDGTPAGLARMTLFYTTGAAAGFLAVAALWSSAASISSDVKTRTLQLVRVKPVRMIQLWLGKWAGLLVLNAVLLFLVFVGVYAHVAASGVLANEDIAVAKRLFSPILPSIESQIDIMVQNISATQEMTPSDIRDLRSQLRRQLPYATASLQSGAQWIWHFETDRALSAGERVWMRFKFQTDALAQNQPRANGFLAVTGERSGTTFSISDFTAKEMDISLAAPQNTSGNTKFDIVISHNGEKDSSPVIVQPRRGIFLMQAEGPLELNMFRAYLTVLSVIALLLALGLTAGAFFTMPVAVFTTTCLIISVLTSSYVVSDPDILEIDDHQQISAVQRMQYTFSANTTRAIAAISAPTLKSSPLSRLADSEWIPGEELFFAIAGNAVLIPLALAILSSIHLAKKELPE